MKLMKKMGRTRKTKASIRLLLIDFMMGFLWVWAGGLVKIAHLRFLEMGIVEMGDFLRYFGSVLVMFLFAWLGIVSNGGSYNPLTVLSQAVVGDFSDFVFTVMGRIPCQVIGSIMAVSTIKEIFPEVGRGPRLNVDIHRGALTEGLLTFTVVMISLGLKQRDPKSFFMKTWIHSISKLSLHILGSDLTGGCMNPASAFAWAYALGKHTSREHLVVYWLAPIEGTLLSIWIFRLIFGSPTRKKKED